MVNSTNSPAYMPSRPSRRHAYTLAEVLVASGLMVVLAAIVLTGLLFVQRSSAALATRAALQDEAHLATLRMERDIESMTRIDSLGATEWSLQLFDALTETSDTIVYWFDADNRTLFRISEATGQERPLLRSLRSAQFQFFSRQGATTDPQNVRRVAFEGVLMRASGRRQVIEQLVTASFLIRNTQEQSSL